MCRSPWKASWAAWSLVAALICGSGLAFAPRSSADAPAAVRVSAKQKRPARSGSQPSTRTRPPKPKPKSKHRVRVRAHAPKAGEADTRDVATGPDAACHLQLREAGVPFVKVAGEYAPQVLLPIRLTGALAGIEIHGTGKKTTHYLDCRLALALLDWVPQLRATGIVRIDHYSIYRQDAEVSATHKPSGHAAALAIDAGRFHLADGRILSVLDSWTDKTKGADPCAPRPQETADAQLLRNLVCDAARHGIFQTIVTPHHNPDHDNHVHLEVSSSLAPSWIH